MTTGYDAWKTRAHDDERGAQHEVDETEKVDEYEYESEPSDCWNGNGSDCRAGFRCSECRGDIRERAREDYDDRAHEAERDAWRNE